MKLYFYVLLFLGSSAFASQEKLNLLGLHDVVVPTVWDDPAVADRIQGMMYFDASDGSLKFVGDSSTPITIAGTSNTSVLTSGSSDRIERASVSSGGTVTQPSSWISGCSYASGQWTCNFVTSPAAVFSSTPVCTITPAHDPAANGAVGITSVSSSAISIDIVHNNSSTQLGFHIICMGAR